MPEAQPQAPKTWKTKTSAILGAITGLSGLAIYFLSGPEAAGAMPPTAAGAVIAASLAVIGLGDKLQKLINLLKDK